MHKLVLAAAISLTGCCDRGPDAQPVAWTFGVECPDQTFMVCRDGGLFHCDETYVDNPAAACTYVNSMCMTDPTPEQQIAAAAACGSTCNGAALCDKDPPQCPAGEVPLIVDGCYAASCQPIEQCDVAPPCSAITDETSCLARTDCSPDYEGLDCTSPTGESCEAGTNDCTCASFEFIACEAI